jgi:site-specific DNA-methyltransferase (adenine-specific)
MSFNKSLFSSESDLWATPQDFFDSYNKEFNFTLDVCATEENAKCKNFFTKEQDGLKQPWGGVVWCNPPYGREISMWIKKAYEESLNGSTVVLLLPSRTDTKWFHEILIEKGAIIKFIKGRLKFGKSKNSAPFPSLIAVFEGKNAEKTI